MRRAMAQDPAEFDPRKFLKDATAAARDLCEAALRGLRLRRPGAAHQAGAARENGGALRLRIDPRLPRAARFLIIAAFSGHDTLPAVSDADLANALRALAMDAVQAAKSGHPGMPMGMAEIAVALWDRHLRHNPANPAWANRDRFVLSNGHGSMLLYALLHLTGYDLPMEELQALPPAALEDAGPPGVRPYARAWKPPPVRSGRASPTPSAWRSPSGCWPREFNRPGLRHRRPPHLRLPGRRLHDGRHLARGLLARRHARPGQARSRSTTTTASRSTRRRATSRSGTPTTCRSASQAYGWQVIAERGRPRRRRRCTARSARRSARSPRPTLICCKTVIAQGRAAQGQHRRGARRAAGRRRKSPRRARPSAGAHPAFDIPAGRLRRLGRARAGERAERRWSKLLRRTTRGAIPDEAAEFLRRAGG